MFDMMVQVYTARLQVHAQLSGLRHIMYHHPWISSVSGVVANIIILTVIILISWSRWACNMKEALGGFYIIFHFKIFNPG